MQASQPRPLYLMVKPPRDVADRIARGVRSARGPEMLHMTLLPLGDRREISDATLQEWIEAIGRMQLFAFRTVFDRIHESEKTVALRGSEPIEGALAFYDALRSALTRERVPLPGYSFRPHITLNYHRDGLGSGQILPLSWLVEDFRLIESVYGEGRHIEHARFPLLTAGSLDWSFPLAA